MVKSKINNSVHVYVAIPISVEANTTCLYLIMNIATKESQQKQRKSLRSLGLGSTCKSKKYMGRNETK